ncbi:MAG: folate-binding protein YgfZ [Acetobacteraceae bacterium]|nr:folate-binding protein YgfZ [Acetobacteraceae bacterium]
MTWIAALPRRGVIEVAGEDRVSFLQGLVSNDIENVAPGQAVWAALLTPQGKWLADFFVFADGERLLLDAEREQLPMLVQRLMRFRLRSKATLRVLDDMGVFAGWEESGAKEHPLPLTEGAGERGLRNNSREISTPPPKPLPPGEGEEGPAPIAAPDPRLPEAGWRLLLEAPLPVNATEEAWDVHRLTLGLPDGSRDLEAEKTVLLEAGFDELNGISWAKGCYMGQELTARTKYRGLVKRRLVPVIIEGVLPALGTPILKNGAEVGSMRSGRGAIGLAVLRLDALAARLECGGAALTPQIPAWMRLTEGVP